MRKPLAFWEIILLMERTEGSLDNGSELEGEVLSVLRTSFRLRSGPASMDSFLNPKMKFSQFKSQ